MSVPVGWYPASTLFAALGYTYNGIVDSIDNASSDGYQLLVTKKPHLYSYYNDETEIKKSKIITSDDLDSSGGPSIIYATEKPSTPQQAIYVITEDEVVRGDIYNYGELISPVGGYCEIVDELPETPEPLVTLNADMTTVEYMYVYYLTKDSQTWGYVDKITSAAFQGSVPVGWIVASALGCVTSTSVDDMTEDVQGVLLTKQPKTRVYVPLPDGTFLELTSGIRTRFDEHSGNVSITEM